MQEGIIRENVYIDGKYFSTIKMGILKREFTLRQGMPYLYPENQIVTQLIKSGGIGTDSQTLDLFACD